MASEFLRKKAQEQAESISRRFGNSDSENAQQNPRIENEKAEGGNAPPSAGNTTYESTRASSFLRQKAEEQAASITQRFGEDAYGGTNWRSQDNALTTENLASLLEQIQGLGTLGTPADALKTSGGYYSRPEAAQGLDDIARKVSYLSPALREYAIPVDTAWEEVQKSEAQLKIVSDYLDRAKQAYTASPTQRNADAYNQIAAYYDQAYQVYSGKYGAYEEAYGKYSGTQQQVAKIFSDYEKYITGQQTAFDDWRSTIRDGDEVQKDMANVEQLIASQETAVRQLKGMARLGGEEDEQTYLRAEANLQKLKDLQALLQEEYDWSQYYRYNDLTQAEDFKQKSGYVSTANGLKPVFNIQTGRYDQTGFGDLMYDYINRNERAVEMDLVNNGNVLGTDKTQLLTMSDQEISIFNYLYATQGADAAYAYTDYLTKDLNKRHRMEQEDIWSDWAKDHPVATSAFSVLTSPLRGLSFLGQAADLIRGKEIDPNATYNKFSYIPNTIRGEVSKKIEESGKWGSVGSFAYQTGMSMADFLFSTVASGGNSALAMTIMGSGAAADTTIAARERGVESWKAFTLGAVAGIAEAVTEKFSLEALLDPKLLKDSVLKYIGKNMLAEGSEEAASSLINLFSDIMISGDKSEWRQAIDGYMTEDGMSEKEAFLQVFKDQALGISLDALGGAISGGVLGGGNAALQRFRNSRMTKPYDLKHATENDAQALIDSGLESAEDTESYQLAKELQKKLDAGKIPSAEELSRLAMANQIAIQEEAAEEEAEPEGLQLPKLEEETMAGGEPARDLNGGTNYENTQGTQEHAAAETSAGTGVLSGSSQRYDGAGTREQASRLGGRAGQTAARNWPGADAARTAVRRTNLGKNLPKISSASLGLSAGVDATRIRVIPREYWDESMAAKAEQVYQETGKEITYVLGSLEFRNTQGGISKAKGAILDDRIIVQANHHTYTAEQIADHESFHGMVNEYKQKLINDLSERIVEEYSEEEFHEVLNRYILALRAVIDVGGAKDPAEYAQRVSQVMEEMLADAHAGMNMWDFGATKFTETVNRFLDENMISRKTSQENGVRETNGPPDERYSYAGEKARTADLEALARAKQMQAAGVAEETIRQETGWFQGMDGKWRWEIDDSGMQYYKDGDALFREMHPEYERHQELTRKFIYGELNPKEELELRDLDEEWGSENQRLKDRVKRGNAQLQNLIKHDALFEAYPQLRGAAVRFADLAEGTNGQWDPESRTITLNKELRSAPEGTLVHEIQHIIQGAEGFTMGSSPEFWKDNPVAPPEYAAEIQKARERVADAEAAFHREWSDDINLDLAKKYVELDNQYWAEEREPEFHQRLQEQMGEIEQAAADGGWEDLFDEYFYASGELQMAIERGKMHSRTPQDLYRNTAGEIEARDAAGRRKLTPEQRRETEPAKGDERTVFAEGNENPSLQSDDKVSFDNEHAQNYAGRSLVNDPEIYSYEFLISQPAMRAVILPEVGNVRDNDGKVDPTKVAENGMKMPFLLVKKGQEKSMLQTGIPAANCG